MHYGILWFKCKIKPLKILNKGESPFGKPKGAFTFIFCASPSPSKFTTVQMVLDHLRTDRVRMVNVIETIRVHRPWCEEIR